MPLLQKAMSTFLNDNSTQTVEPFVHTRELV
jgi:hypothetical protein